MKNITYIIIVALGILCSTACTYNKSEKEVILNSKYAVDAYYTQPQMLVCDNYNKLKSKQESSSTLGDLPKNTLFLLGFDHFENGEDLSRRCVYFPIGDPENIPEDFKEIAEGFEEYGTASLSNVIGSNFSLPEMITNIKIIALSDFNNNHASGSDISEIARVTYNSYYPFIQNDYIETEAMRNYSMGGLPRLFMDAAWWNTHSVYDMELPKNGENPMVLPALSGNLCYWIYFASVSFTESPSHEEIEFDVTLTYESGKTFNSVFTIDGIEL